jgi:pyrophosphatase PpaX
MVNTLLFDLDGTLVDTNRLIIDTFKKVFEKYFPNLEVPEETIKTFVGPTLVSTFSSYTNDKNLVEELVQYYRKINVEIHDEYVTIYDNVYETLEYLYNKGYNLAVVTSKSKEMAERGLKLFNIDKFFKVVVGCYQVTNHKPHPEVLYKALESFNNVDEVIVVGDTKSDVLAAKNANFYSIGVNWSINLESLLTSNPDYVISNFKEIIDIVEKGEI